MYIVQLYRTCTVQLFQLWAVCRYFSSLTQGSLIAKVEPKRTGSSSGGGYDPLPPVCKELPAEPCQRGSVSPPPPPTAGTLKREAVPTAVPQLSTHSLSLGADLGSCDEVKVSQFNIGWPATVIANLLTELSATFTSASVVFLNSTVGVVYKWRAIDNNFVFMRLFSW